MLYGGNKPWQRGNHWGFIRKYSSFDEMKADEYRYWQSRPAHERLAAASELTQEQYAMKGEAPDRRLDRTLFVRLPNPWRSKP
jgi:hypothetical protein